MANFDTFEDIVADILDRMDEETDGTSDWDATVRRAVVRGFHHFHNVHPWWWIIKDPPGVFLTVAPITRTLTIAASGLSAAGSLSAVVADSIAGRKIKVTSTTLGEYVMRVLTHTAGTADITVDAAPETLSAQSCTIFQDEYDLASDLGIFVDGLWSPRGDFIELMGQERLKQDYPDPPNEGWPARGFARLTARKIRFTTYPDRVDRIEYPYAYAPSDPSGSSNLIVPQNFRWLLSDAGLYFGYLLKSDKRAETAKQTYEGAVGQCMSYAHRVLMGLSTEAGAARPGPYQ